MHRKFYLNMRKNFFTLQVTEHWNRLLREAVQSPSLEIFKNIWISVIGRLVILHGGHKPQDLPGLCWGFLYACSCYLLSLGASIGRTMISLIFPLHTPKHRQLGGWLTFDFGEGSGSLWSFLSVDIQDKNSSFERMESLYLSSSFFLTTQDLLAKHYLILDLSFTCGMPLFIPQTLKFPSYLPCFEWEKLFKLLRRVWRNIALLWWGP